MLITDKYVFFWDGVYSNWYPAPFKIGPLTFNCVEQYMMYSKAMLFNDIEIAEKILDTKSPKEQKALGRRVKNFDVEKWDKVCKANVFDGIYEKFSQNLNLMKLFLNHGKNRKFVEASPYDKIWGIGLSIEEAVNIPESAWLGKNYLGQVLDDVYETLSKEEKKQ